MILLYHVDNRLFCFILRQGCNALAQRGDKVCSRALNNRFSFLGLPPFQFIIDLRSRSACFHGSYCC